MTQTHTPPWAPHMKRVAVLPWPGIDNAYLCVSGKKKRQDRVGDRWYPANAGHDERIWKWNHDFRSDPYISFCYDAGTVIAEWDGGTGPIQLWFKCDEGFKDDEHDWEKAEPHWFYPFAFGRGHWSQMSVDEADLPRRFNEGDYEAIFRELKAWAGSREGADPLAKAEA